MSTADSVRLVEVGPRDGLQNERGVISTATKLELIERLAAAGLHNIEATAFVSPKWVPQMADHSEIMQALMQRSSQWPDVRFPALVPNFKGLEAALETGCREIAIFAAASETFSQKNINCSIAESLARFEPVVQLAQSAGVEIRGYISCVVACPYEGSVAPQRVAPLAKALLDLGCYEVSLGDTIGAGTPAQVHALCETVSAQVPPAQLAGHFHDTWGMACANVVAALSHGVRVFDSSVAGLGGCPYAAGATGNVATEDLVYLLHGMGHETGVDLNGLVDTAWWISAQLGREPVSHVARALEAQRERTCTQPKKTAR